MGHIEKSRNGSLIMVATDRFETELTVTAPKGPVRDALEVRLSTDPTLDEPQEITAYLGIDTLDLMVEYLQQAKEAWEL